MGREEERERERGGAEGHPGLALAVVGGSEWRREEGGGGEVSALVGAEEGKSTTPYLAVVTSGYFQTLQLDKSRIRDEREEGESEREEEKVKMQDFSLRPRFPAMMIPTQRYNTKLHPPPLHITAHPSHSTFSHSSTSSLPSPPPSLPPPPPLLFPSPIHPASRFHHPSPFPSHSPSRPPSPLPLLPPLLPPLPRSSPTPSVPPSPPPVTSSAPSRPPRGRRRTRAIEWGS